MVYIVKRRIENATGRHKNGKTFLCRGKQQEYSWHSKEWFPYQGSLVTFTRKTGSIEKLIQMFMQIEAEGYARKHTYTIIKADPKWLSKEI